MNPNLGNLIKLSFLFFSFSLYGETIEKKYASLKLLNKTTNKVSEREILVNSIVKWETLNIMFYIVLVRHLQKPEDYTLLDTMI